MTADEEKMEDVVSAPWHGRAEKPKKLSCDFETYSSVDIGKSGMYKYMESPDFAILLLAYAFDDEDVKIVDVASGEEIPEEVLEAIEDKEIIKCAWNAAFERNAFSHILHKQLDPEGWQCSMVLAASLSLPLALKNSAKVLKTGEQKDKAGETLIKKFSIPQKDRKTGKRYRVYPWDALADWYKFKDYCLQDVRTERDIRHRLDGFPMTDKEWQMYWTDQRINDRGVLLDMELVEQCIACDLMLSDEMTKRAYELTGLENPNSVSQLKRWLEERGISVDTLGKKNVEQMITDLDKNSVDQTALDMLKLRLQMAKSSVKKYQAAERCVCSDGRARGLFQFYGANRTGRWSGRLLQLQNLSKNHIDTLSQARDLMKQGEFEKVAEIYGDVPDILSQLVRTMLVPKPGCEFIIADFSAIECRVLAWEAGENWVLDSFRAGKDIYCSTASSMFHVPVEKHGINGELRQKGKIATLACIAEGSLVLTNHGEKPIEQVTADDLVWDGCEWVQHEGVIYKGEREVITYEGLTATPDHLVFVEGKPRPIRFGEAATSGAHLVRSGYGRKTVRVGEDNKSGKKMEREVEYLLRSDSVPELWSDSMAVSWEPDERDFKGMPAVLSAKADTIMVGPQTYCSEAAVYKSGRPSVRKLWSKRHQVQVSECNDGGAVSHSEVWFTGSCDGDRQDRQQRRLCTREYTVCDEAGEQWESKDYCPVPVRSGVLALLLSGGNQETFIGRNQRRDNCGCGDGCVREEKELAVYRGKVRVYDIRNAGRRHRFTVSGVLVHNCGYQGGTGALVSMGALEMGLKEEELPDIIESWRNANPKIVQYWWDVEKAAIDTVKTHQEHVVQKIKFQFYANTLWMVLPSGRRLAYMKPKLMPNKYGRMSLTFEGLGTSASNYWVRQETYGGKLVENATQAIARDILAESMLRIQNAGIDIVAHIHDEVILEVPKGKYTVDELCDLMAEAPFWCADLPLASAGYRGDYYYKD